MKSSGSGYKTNNRGEISRYNRTAGMITVEASFLVPFLFFIILAMLYAGLYFLDCAKVYLACDEVLYYAAQSIGKGSDLGQGEIDIQKQNQISIYSFWESNEQEEIEIKKRIQSRLRGKLLLLEMNNIEVKVTSKQVSAELSGNAGSKFWQYFDISFLSFSYQKKVQCANYSDYIRKWEVYGNKE